MNQKYVALIAAIPVLIGMTGLASVAHVSSDDDGRLSHRARFEERRDQLFEQLDLTEAQQTEIQEIHDQAKADNEGLRDELNQARDTMRSLMEGNASADQIRQQHDQIQQLHQQLGDAMLEVRLEVRDVLTDEQRSELAQIIEDRPFHGGGGHRRPGGQRPFQN